MFLIYMYHNTGINTSNKKAKFIKFPKIIHIMGIDVTYAINVYLLHLQS